MALLGEALPLAESLLPSLFSSGSSNPKPATPAAKPSQSPAKSSRPSTPKVSNFGFNTYRFTGYFITVFILLIILFILLDKVTLYDTPVGTNEDLPLNVRLSYKIFISYIIVIFGLLFQYYIYNFNNVVIQAKISMIDEILEIFNLLAIIFITYFIYRQIENIYSVCPLPNKRVCESPGCDGSYACKTYQSFSTCSSDEYKNALVEVDNNGKFSPGSCPSFNEFINNNFDFKSQIPTSRTPSPGTPKTGINQLGDFNKKYDELETEIQSLRDKINDLSKDDNKLTSEVDIPSENKEANISCANDGICPSSSIGCNNQGMCEGFELISFEDKLKLLNNESNFDEACDLMDKLKTFILRTFTN